MIGTILWTLTLTLAYSSAALAATDAEKCEAAKEKAAGKYAFCRLGKPCSELMKCLQEMAPPPPSASATP